MAYTYQTVAVLAIILATAFSCANAVDCDIPDEYSAECNDSFNSILYILNSTGITPENLTTLEGNLDVYCDPECYDVLEDEGFFECVGNISESQENFLNSSLCSYDDMDYCLVRAQQDIMRGTIPMVALSLCYIACADACLDALEETRDTLGCCAASLFTNGIFFNSSIYNMCGVELGDKCSGAAATVPMMFTIAVMVGVVKYIM